MSNGGNQPKPDQSGGALSHTPYWIMLVAVLGFLFPHTGSSPGDRSSPQPTTPTPAPSAAKDSDLSIGARYEAMLQATTGAPRNQDADKNQPSKESMPINSRWLRGSIVIWPTLPGQLPFWTILIKPPEPKFLIATMHDPVDSHLQTYFDADFAVLQRAVQKHGFVLSQHWLPWQEWLRESSNGSGKSRSVRLFERDPGIIVCQRESFFGTERLVVLLVGETPTGGVHPQAFRHALDLASRYETSIRVVGPSASGSCASIRQCLLAWHQSRSSEPPTDVQIHFISGSATSENAIAQLDRLTQKVGESELICDMRTTVLPDSVSTYQMFNYLVKDRDIAARQIALLQEADTLYGQQAFQPDMVKGLKIYDMLVLPYPMEVGSVRNEYEKSRSLKFGPQETTTAPRVNLEVPWVEPLYARDHLPQFSDATPAVTERRMSMMLLALARRDIRAVGLLGTDPKDLLYLAQQIRRYCPNVQLFTFESNVLFTHPDYVDLFKGTIVASTYPSFMNNQEWCRLSPQRLTTQFSSSLSEGVLNAALGQLEQMYPADQSTPLVEYSKPFDPTSYGTPPLWLSVVGQAGLLPAKAVWPPPELKPDLLYKPKPLRTAAVTELFLGLPPFTFGSIIVNLAVSAIAIAFLLQNMAWKRTRNLQRRYAPEVLNWLRLPTARLPAAKDSNSRLVFDRWSCWYALVLFLFLFAVQLVTNTINRKVGSLPNEMYACHWQQLLARILSFVSFCLLLFAGYLVFLRWLQFKGGIVQRIRRRWSAGLVVLAIVVSGGVLTFAPWYSNDRLETAIKVERWGRLLDGVTPLFPLSCMAMIPVLWAICQLRRKHLGKVHHLGQPFCEVATPGLASRLSQLNSKLTRSFWTPTELRDWILVFGIVWFGANLINRWIKTADAPYFDWLLLTFAIINVTLIYTLHVRFMAASGLLERLLRRVAQTNLSGSFRAVPPRLKTKAAGQIFSASPHLGDLDIVISELQRLVNKLPYDKNQLQAFCSEARRRFNILDSSERANKAFVARWIDSINEPLRQSCRLVIKHLFERPSTVLDATGNCERIADRPESSEEEWKGEARKFVATQLTTLVRQAFAQIQNLLVFLTMMLLLLLFALYSYPFQPQRYLSLCLIGLICWIVGTIVITFIRLNRNEVLSNLSETSANRFTPDRALVRQLLVFGLIPLLSLLAFQFPEIGNVIFFWSDGLQRAVR